MTDDPPDLEGDVVQAVRESSTYDLVVEFESGRDLHVANANWWMEDGAN